MYSSIFFFFTTTIRKFPNIWRLTQITIFLIIINWLTVPAIFSSASIIWITSTSRVNQNSFVAQYTFSSYRIDFCTIFLLYFNTFTIISGWSISKYTPSTYSIRWVHPTIVHFLGWFCTYSSGDIRIWFLAQYARTKQTTYTSFIITTIFWKLWMKRRDK